MVSGTCLKTEDGQTSGAVALLYDLSLIKRLERNVQRADRLSSIGTLAAGMAHEIKNPLVSIKTFTQLLADRYKDPEFRATFEEVVPHEVERIDTIVSRLLDFARPRPVAYTQVNLRRTIEEVLALLENQLRKGFVTVKIDFPETPVYVNGDDQQLHQVFLNLFLNAFDAMKADGEGTLTIRARPSYLFQRRKGISSLVERNCVRVTVTDSGCGIPGEKLPEVFTPFFTTKEEGCGLGLAVVHGIVEEHGGEIDVASVMGEGTTFTVSLPMVTVPESAEESVVR
jgi:two-component system nitrogen regulation sensor histidine kinase GlnL